MPINRISCAHRIAPFNIEVFGSRLHFYINQFFFVDFKYLFNINNLVQLPNFCANRINASITALLHEKLAPCAQGYPQVSWKSYVNEALIAATH